MRASGMRSASWRASAGRVIGSQVPWMTSVGWEMFDSSAVTSWVAHAEADALYEQTLAILDAESVYR